MKCSHKYIIMISEVTLTINNKHLNNLWHDNKQKQRAIRIVLISLFFFVNFNCADNTDSTIHLNSKIHYINIFLPKL